MRIVVLRNSIAGRGRGRAHVDHLLAALAQRGHDPLVLDVHRPDGTCINGELDAALVGADALLVAGGDGTLHHSAPSAMRAGVPVYHYPLGTENLFARQFSMGPSATAAIGAIERNQRQTIDTALCNERSFLLMCSIGFDSCVVERVAANRRGGITRGTYLQHALAEALRPRFVPVSVHVDGTELVDDRPGVVVIANSRQYAARLDPAREASMTDGLLDIVFLPIGSRIALARRLAQVARGAHMSDRTVVRARGAQVQVSACAAAPYQLDGEHAGTLAPGASLAVRIAPASLHVLTP